MCTLLSDIIIRNAEFEMISIAKIAIMLDINDFSGRVFTVIEKVDNTIPFVNINDYGNHILNQKVKLCANINILRCLDRFTYIKPEGGHFTRSKNNTDVFARIDFNRRNNQYIYTAAPNCTGKTRLLKDTSMCHFNNLLNIHNNIEKDCIKQNIRTIYSSIINTNFGHNEKPIKSPQNLTFLKVFISSGSRRMKPLLPRYRPIRNIARTVGILEKSSGESSK